MYLGARIDKQTNGTKTIFIIALKAPDMRFIRYYLYTMHEQHNHIYVDIGWAALKLISFVPGILDTILSVQPKEGGGGGGETRESVVYQLAEDMLRKLPPKYNAFEVREALNRMGALLPMNIFFRFASKSQEFQFDLANCALFISDKNWTVCKE